MRPHKTLLYLEPEQIVITNFMYLLVWTKERLDGNKTLFMDMVVRASQED